MKICQLFAHTAACFAVATLSIGGAAPPARAQGAEVIEAAAQTPRVGDVAPDFELADLQGEQVKLSALSERGPVVLVALRGFSGYQCPLCTAQVGELIQKASDFEKAGARVLMIYPGPAEGLKAHADEFVRGKDMPANFILALDPDFAFTKQYGLRWDAPGETAYPSTFVLDTARKVLYAKISRTHGDRAPVEDVLAALPK
jgi:peroxiredoxin